MQAVWWLIAAQIVTIQAYIPRNCSVRTHSKNYVCGVAGFPGKDVEPTGKPFYVSSIELCRDIALASFEGTYQAPYSFSFDINSNMCTLYFLISNAVVKDEESTSYFYRPECFRCARPSCPFPSSTNLLLNSGFELTNEISAPWLAKRGKGGYQSEYAAVVSTVQDSLLQTVPLCLDSFYKLTFDYKVIGPTSKKAFFIDYSFAGRYNPLIIVDASDVVNKDWRRSEDLYVGRLEPYDKEFPPLISLKPSFFGDANTKLLIDNIELFAVVPEEAVLTQPNSSSLFENGGFESGEIAPWTVQMRLFPGAEGSATVIPRGIDSGNALQLKNSGGSSIYFDIGQTVPTNPFTQYVLSFDFLVNLRGQDQRSSSSLSVYAITRSRGYNKSSIILDRYDIRKGGLHSIVLPVLADGDSLVFDMVIFSDNGEDFRLDNIQLLQAVHTG